MIPVTARSCRKTMIEFWLDAFALCSMFASAVMFVRRPLELFYSVCFNPYIFHYLHFSSLFTKHTKTNFVLTKTIHYPSCQPSTPPLSHLCSICPHPPRKYQNSSPALLLPPHHLRRISNPIPTQSITTTMT